MAQCIGLVSIQNLRWKSDKYGYDAKDFDSKELRHWLINSDIYIHSRLPTKSRRIHLNAVSEYSGIQV